MRLKKDDTMMDIDAADAEGEDDDDDDMTQDMVLFN